MILPDESAIRDALAEVEDPEAGPMSNGGTALRASSVQRLVLRS